MPLVLQGAVLSTLAPKWASQLSQEVKNHLLMQEARSLGREGSLEKEMATLSSILAWKVPWTEELACLYSMESQESDMLLLGAGALG